MTAAATIEAFALRIAQAHKQGQDALQVAWLAETGLPAVDAIMFIQTDWAKGVTNFWFEPRDGHVHSKDRRAEAEQRVKHLERELGNARSNLSSARQELQEHRDKAHQYAIEASSLICERNKARIDAQTGARAVAKAHEQLEAATAKCADLETRLRGERDAHDKALRDLEFVTASRDHFRTEADQLKAVLAAATAALNGAQPC